MSNKECPICFEKLGKIYKELPCGHRFHFGCIKTYENFLNNKDLHCSYCRTNYSVMTLRKRNPELSDLEKGRKVMFTNNIKFMLDEVASTQDKNKKVIIINKIFYKIKKDIDMLINPKFKFKKLLIVIKDKLNELSYDLNNNDYNITDKEKDNFEVIKSFLIHKFNNSNIK